MARTLGHKMTIETYPEEAYPSNFMRLCEVAAQQSAQVSQEMFLLPRDDFFARDHELRAPLEKLSNGHEGVRRALSAIYIQGSIERCEKFARSDGDSGESRRDRRALIHMGARLQRHLMLAFLQLPQRGRRLLLDTPAFFGLHRRRWREQYIGAMSAARVAYWLLDMGLEVKYPTPETDMKMGIDLLAGNPRRTTDGICVQIRSGRNKPLLVTYFLEEPTEETLPLAEGQRKCCEKVWRGTQRFNEIFGLDWTPVFVSCGLQTRSVADLETTSWLGQAIKSKINEIPEAREELVSQRSTPAIITM